MALGDYTRRKRKPLVPSEFLINKKTLGDLITVAIAQYLQQISFIGNSDNIEDIRIGHDDPVKKDCVQVKIKYRKGG